MSTVPPESEKPAPAAIMAEQEALPPGTRFGELEIVRVLGVGGFGIVYLARDHSLERDVALKEYMPASLATRGVGPQITVRSGALSETYAVGLRSFVNEARLLAKFDHPSLVKVYRFWEDNATAYMVMPYLQGRTLREVRRSMGTPPDEAWVRGVLLPVMGALETLHRDGVFHRDIAPDNIMLPLEGPPVLLDFGAARRVISDRTQSLTAILKPSYAPIEQYAEMTAMRQGPWTDIYALGAVVHFLLRGAPPSPATARALQDELAPLWGSSFAGASPRFLAAIDWALAVRPQERPQSIDALRAVLEGRAEPPVLARTVPGSTSLMPVSGATPKTGYEPTQVATVGSARPEPTFQPTVRAQPPSSAQVPAAAPTRVDAPAAVAAPAPAAQAMAAAPPTSRKGLVGAALVLVAVLAGAAGWQYIESRREGEAVVSTPATAPPPAPAVQATPAPMTEPVPAAPATAAVTAPVTEAVPVPSVAAAPAPATTPPAAGLPMPRPAVVSAAPAAAPRPQAAPAPEAAADERSANPTATAGEPTRAERARALRDAVRAQREAQAQANAQAQYDAAANPSAARVPLGARVPGTVALGAPQPGDVPLGAAPRGPATAREACGSRVLVAMWNCMQRECRNPRYAQQGECVKVNEDRRQRELQ